MRAGNLAGMDREGGLIKTLQKCRTVVARRIFNVFLNNE